MWKQQGLLLLLLGVQFMSSSKEQVVIAHRGASGYLPEHTLEAKAMAHAMGADYIEQDLVMTKDNRLVVLHDRFLDRVTDVAKKFPDRKRADGRYYAIDFTLAEIKTLEVTEGFKVEGGKTVSNYPDRFPIWKSSFKVPTFEEEIELIQGMNHSRGTNIGIYPEIKSPWFHRKEGKDISDETLKVLKKYGYTQKSDKVYLQCFDPHELRRIKSELLQKNAMDLKLVQLIAETDWHETMEKNEAGEYVPYNYDWMFESGAMEKIAKYSDGVGPWKPMIVKDESTKDNLLITDLVKDAHAAGMEVHPYTFRLDKGRIPPYATDFDDLLAIFYDKVGVDGIFTDFPDRAVQFLARQKMSK